MQRLTNEQLLTYNFNQQMNKRHFTTLLATMLTGIVFAQPTHVIIDEEKEFKTVKEFIAKEQYAFAYPLVKELKVKYPANKKTDHAYINDDINYYNALCELKLFYKQCKQPAPQPDNEFSPGTLLFFKKRFSKCY